MRIILSFFLLIVILSSCDDEPKRTIERRETPAVVEEKITLLETPSFNADSAYAYVEQQVAFGPRVPNTLEHKKTAQWLEKKLSSFGLETSVQEAEVRAFNKESLEIYNIMARYRPEVKDRIMLSAHWDTRPFADRDRKKRNQPIDGANDGGSGVAVLLELARVIGQDSIGPNIGFDIVLFDAEDYGKPATSMFGESSDTWCLGSQHWSTYIPFEDYKPKYGILLDMVGAENAVFPKEGVSMYYAPEVVNKVWDIAQEMGHTNYFINVKGNPITDDHAYLNKIARIPTIDIIHYEVAKMDFGHFHHTHKDNMDVISKETLGVVGEVMLQVIYQE